MFDSSAIKKDFPIFERYREKHGRELTYLDSAASSQTPAQVVAAMDEYYFGYRSNVHRSPYDLGVEATSRYEEARASIARFIGAEPDEVIFTSGATAGANMLARMLEGHLSLGPGDEVATTVLEHHSNFVPFQELALRSKASFVVLPLRGTDIDYDEAERRIGERTKVVTFPVAGNALGTIHDVKRLTARARKIGALVVLDASKAAGHMPLSVREVDCDFLFFSGHKMLGPTGTGVLYGKRELLAKLRPSSFGGGIVESVSEAETLYREEPARFEPGTPNVAGAIGLAAAAEYLDTLGLQNVREHESALVRYATKHLSAIHQVRVVSEPDPEKNIGIVSFVVEGIHPHDVAEILGREGVAIRGGHHCAMPLMKALGVSSVCRASFYVYNDEKDVDRLAEALGKAKELFS